MKINAKVLSSHVQLDNGKRNMNTTDATRLLTKSVKEMTKSLALTLTEARDARDRDEKSVSSCAHDAHELHGRAGVDEVDVERAVVDVLT